MTVRDSATTTATGARPLRARDVRLAPWRAFLVAHARVSRRLDEDLRLEHALTLSEYEALLLLAEADGRRVRMRVLAEDLQLSKSGVTRLVDRLVEDGLVERGQCTTDARGAEAVLTPAGLDRLRTAAPTHLRGIQEYFLATIPAADLSVVERAMLGIADSLSGWPFARGSRGPRVGEVCAPEANAAETSRALSQRRPGPARPLTANSQQAAPNGPVEPPPSTGRLYAGTSGFAYADWAPRFYPAGIRPDALLESYAGRLPACELNNTYYRWPDETRIRAWAAATPDTFRFAVKAQRSAPARARGAGAAAEVERLVAPLGAFGRRLGSVLFRIPEGTHRDDDRLAGLLDAWPRTVPITLELQHASWHVDETFAALRAHGAVLCATELPEDELPPTIRLTGSFLYLRLRRHDYDADEVAAWAARIQPFLSAGTDVYAFFRHDAVGRAAELAEELRVAIDRLVG